MKTKTRSGRPTKFNEESGVITVTLPHRIVSNLKDIDMDRAKAIVKCVDSMTSRVKPEEKKVDVVQVSKDTALLIMPPSKNLKNIPWLQLVEIAPSRFLLVLPSGTAIEALEIALVDLIEQLPEDDIADKILLTDLRQKISQHRRNDGFSKGEIIFIHMMLLLGIDKSIFTDYLSTAVGFC